MTCLVLVTVVASFTMVVKGIMYQPAVAANEEKAALIRESIEYENRRIEEIDSMMQKVGTDEYIEKVAREKLGMIKSDEIVFVDISGQ
ncbi:MAG: septum formation initiator family protein [Clostridia bacterium]|nr:septum formation initiator family protein [Clostridia bacterium]